MASVRNKKAMMKERHKMNRGIGGKVHANPKNLRLSEMAEGMQAKGINVTKDALRARSKSRRTLGDLEDA